MGTTVVFLEGAGLLIGRHFAYALVENKNRDQRDAQIPFVDGRVIGYVGINAVCPSPELEYSIHPDYWGKGYAIETTNGLWSCDGVFLVKAKMVTLLRRQTACLPSVRRRILVRPRF
jgi:hypothetical protein